MSTTDQFDAPDSRARRGSALLTAVIFSAVILLGIAGLMPMLTSDWKQSARTSLQEAAFSLAESAVDEAVWAVLEHAEDDSAWRADGWSEGKNGRYWYREWTLTELSKNAGKTFELDEGRSGRYRAIVEKVAGSRVAIVAQGIVSGGRNVSAGTEIARYIETEFRRPNPAGYGLIARDTLTFNGRPTFDSYDSREFPYTYLFGVNSGSNATVGSISKDKASTLNLGRSTIFGPLATGAADDGSDPSGGATVTGGILWEFEMEFPAVTTPNTSGWTNTVP